MMPSPLLLLVSGLAFDFAGCFVLRHEVSKVAKHRGKFQLFLPPRRKVLLHFSTNNDIDKNRALVFDSPVLTQVYHSLLDFKEKFGHVNIPLGSSEGRKCETLRRLQVQGKLTDRDQAVLDELGFRWHSLEDVYHTSDFDDLLQRLRDYADQSNGDLSPPKKYEPDPELGAWVTGIRRVGRNGLLPEHASALDEIGFSWTSTRKCGSAFMNRYREINQLKDAEGDAFLDDPKVQQWIRAQQEAVSRGALSETRMHYMEQLLPGWLEWKP